MIALAEKPNNLPEIAFGNFFADEMNTTTGAALVSTETTWCPEVEVRRYAV
jgi:hypothetical protein